MASIVRYNGRLFCATGKLGHRFDSGVAVAEYEEVGERNGSRIWVDAAGNVYPE